MEESINASFWNWGILGFLVHTQVLQPDTAQLPQRTRESSTNECTRNLANATLRQKSYWDTCEKRSTVIQQQKHLNHRAENHFEQKMSYKLSSVIQQSDIAPLSCFKTCCWTLIQINLSLSLALWWTFNLQFLCISTRYNLVFKWGWVKQTRFERFILRDLWAEKHAKSCTRLIKELVFENVNVLEAFY